MNSDFVLSNIDFFNNDVHTDSPLMSGYIQTTDGYVIDKHINLIAKNALYIPHKSNDNSLCRYNILFKSNSSLDFEKGSRINVDLISFFNNTMIRNIDLSQTKFEAKKLTFAHSTLENLQLPKELVNVNLYIDLSDSAIKKIVLPENIKIIPNFENCHYITEIDIPSSACYFVNDKSGNRPFDKCYSLTKLSLNGFNNLPFDIVGCPKLKNIVLSNIEYDLSSYISIDLISKNANLDNLSKLSKLLAEKNYVLDFGIANLLINNKLSAKNFDFYKYNEFYNNYLSNGLLDVCVDQDISKKISFFALALGVFDKNNDISSKALQVFDDWISEYNLIDIKRFFSNDLYNFSGYNKNIFSLFSSNVLSKDIISNRRYRFIEELISKSDQLELVIEDNLIVGIIVHENYDDNRPLYLMNFDNIKFIRINGINYDITGIKHFSLDDIDIISNVAQYSNSAKKRGVKLEYGFVQQLIFRFPNDASEDLSYKFYKKIQDRYLSNLKDEVIPETLEDFQKFCFLCGLFDNDAETANKAYTAIEAIVSSPTFSFEAFETNFNSVVMSKTSNEFRNFITSKNVVKDLINEFSNGEDNSGFISYLFNYFEEVQQTNLSTGHSHRQLVPTMQFFKMKYLTKELKGITPQTEAIANELIKFPHLYGMSLQDAFDMACNIYEEGKQMEIKFPDDYSAIKEIETFSKIESCSKKIQQNNKLSLEYLNHVVQNNFTFEWLSKNDPQNFTLGFYCGCCATIGGVGDGIMRSSIILPNVRNLVIKNAGGEIVAKSTMYINQEQGYAVCNNVEMSCKVKDKETIYKKVMLGVDTFVKQYNQKHQDKPIVIVNMGTDLNDLSEQFELHSRDSDILQAIDFGDYGIKRKYKGNWQEQQKTIWTIEDGQIDIQK